MNKVIIVALALVFIGGGVFFFTQSNSTPEQQTTEPAAMKRLPENAVPSEQTTTSYTGSVLAGKTTPYLEFNKADYEKAKQEGRLIVLNFYADWCPICRAEQPDAKAAFDSLNIPNVVGFQVNFKDDQTDADEQALAKEFAIPYQHTKVILKDGKEILKETAQWDKNAFVDAIKFSIISSDAQKKMGDL